MNDEFDQNDPLWKLLGKAAPAPVSTSFSRNVIRAIRNQDSPSRSEPFFHGFLRWFIPAGAVAALALVLSVSLQPHDKIVTDQFAATEFYEALTFREMAQLDDLVASSAGWAWDDVAP